MEIFLLILAFLCMLIGIIGCIVPGLPGTPIAYAGLWIAQATDRVDFSWQLLLIWAVVTIVVSVLDYVVPAWGTKRFGGTKWGVWGSTIGVFVGLFFGAAGVIIAPLVGADLWLVLLSANCLAAKRCNRHSKPGGEVSSVCSAARCSNSSAADL